MFLAHVMTYGGAEDLASAERFYTHDAFRRVLQIAPAKIFGPISWHFWHRRLLNVQPPEMPHEWFGFRRRAGKWLITADEINNLRYGH